MAKLIEEIGGIIVSPQEMMKKISEKDELKNAFIVVLLAGILGGIWMGTTFPITMPELMPLIPFGFAEWLVSGLILTLLSWVIGAGIYRLIAKLLGGKGEYKKVLQLTGYAHMPYLLVYPLSMITLPVSLMLSGVVDMIGGIWALVLAIFAIGIAEGFSKLRALAVLVLSIITLVVLIVIISVIIAVILMPVPM